MGRCYGVKDEVSGNSSMTGGIKASLPSLSDIDIRRSLATESRNLRDLFLLRTISIAGQITIIGFTHWQLGLRLPLLPLAAIVAALCVWNLLTWLRLTNPRPVSRLEFFVQVAADVLALTGLLYFTGGATNPFAWIYLLPLMVLTINLPGGYAWGMAVITILAYSSLMAWYVPLPLPGTHMQHDSGFSQHIFGMWFGFVLSALLMVHFISHMARNLRERDRQLAAAREKALRDQRLIALGTLAAGAAHELGTPLGTMAVVTKELLRDYPPDRDAELHSQLEILHGQTQRCKDALSVISASSGITQAAAGGALEPFAFLTGLVRQWHSHRPDVAVNIDNMEGPGDRRILADETLRQAISNILDNAADASPDDVTLQARWDSRELLLRVLDRGEGLHPTISDAIGESQTSTKENGLGLGLFLAHGAIQRLGGEVQLFDRSGGGVCTEIRLPLCTAQQT